MGYGKITVGVTPTLIVADNAKRKSLTLVNTSESAVVWIGPDDGITSMNAIVLYETQTRDNQKDFGNYLGPVYGITHSAGVTADVRYWEVEANL